MLKRRWWRQRPTAWWLNQPIWNLFEGWKQHIWNHQPATCFKLQGFGFFLLWGSKIKRKIRTHYRLCNPATKKGLRMVHDRYQTKTQHIYDCSWKRQFLQILGESLELHYIVYKYPLSMIYHFFHISKSKVFPHDITVGFCVCFCTINRVTFRLQPALQLVCLSWQHGNTANPPLTFFPNG